MVEDTHYDLLILGTTPAGLCCAVRAAREGLTVLLATHSHYLGGMLSSGLGVWDTCYEGARAPLVEEFKARLRAYYRDNYGEDSAQYNTYVSTLSLEPRAGERVFNDMVGDLPGITVLKQVYPIAIERSERLLQAVTFQDMNGETTTRIEADHFVDASYEADLAAVAGVPYRVGREARDEYGEPHAGKVFTQFTYGLFPYEAAIGKLNLRTFDLNSLGMFAGSTGEGDDAVQAYNFRSILCNDPDNRRPIEKPDNYDRSTYLVLLMSEEERYGKEFPLRSTWLIQDIEDFKFRNWKALPNNKLSWNHGGFVGQNHGYPCGDWPTRQAIVQQHKDFDMGLLYFLQHDQAVPEIVRERAQEWGLARDEFTDNENFPYEIYVREARRIVGRYVFTEHDASIAPGLKRAPIFEDSIAITEWPMDSHECRMERQAGSASDGMVLLNEKTRPAQVPYRILLTEQFDNLLMNVCVSATHVGWGTVRVEPTMMHIGESLGYALSLSHARHIPAAELDVAELQHKLVDSGVMLSFFNEFDMDTEADWVPALQYLGTKGFFASYDATPNAPLDTRTMQLWLRHMGDLLETGADVNARARLLAQVETATENAVNADSFVEALNAELVYRDRAKIEDRQALGIESDTMTVAAAGLAIYRILRNQ